MKALWTFAIAMIAGLGLADDAHIGFEIEANPTGHPTISRVYRNTPAERLGIKPGSKLTSLSGLPVKDGDTLSRRLSNKKPGDKVPIRIQETEKAEAKSVELVSATKIAEQKAKEDADAARREAIAKAQADREKAAKEKSERLLAAMEKINEKHGAVVVAGGTISDDIIGNPQLSVTLCNASPMEIDAVEFRVELFDKFDRPANGLFGSGNEKVFIHQTLLEPKSLRTIVAPVPFHDTVGKALVSVVRYIPKNGSPVEVANPYVTTVSR